MSSSFKGKNLFGSGPHRFSIGKQGQFVVPDFALGASDAASVYLGLLELNIFVHGRLVSSSESGLWTLRDAVVAELLNPPTAGTLVDLNGRSWSSVSFIGYTEGDRTDRGRVKSLAYTAAFRKFDSAP